MRASRTLPDLRADQAKHRTRRPGNRMYMRGRAQLSLAVPTNAERPQADAGTSAADDTLDRDNRRDDGENLRKVFVHVITSFLTIKRMRH